MPTTNKGKLQVTVRQIYGTERVHTLWPMKFCSKAGANLFSLTHKLSQGNKIASDQQNNILVNTPTRDIILDCRIKTRDGWINRVDFLCEAIDKRAVPVFALPKKNVDNLHVELGHPSETITQATTKALGIQVTGNF